MGALLGKKTIFINWLFLSFYYCIQIGFGLHEIKFEEKMMKFGDSVVRGVSEISFHLQGVCESEECFCHLLG